jgi:PKHD-type hydroxylase
MLVSLQAVIPETEVRALRGLLASAPFGSGVATAAPEAASIKNNLQLPVTHPIAVEAATKIVAACGAHEAFQAAVLPAASTSPRFCRYDAGMGYGAHHDVPVMGAGANRMRSDIAVTVSLSAADDYEGGELVIDTAGAAHAWKGNAGDCVIYPANTRHRVDPVTRGSRSVAILWVQSLVRDPAERRILFDLWTSCASLERGSDHAEVVRLRRCYDDLLRMWAEP